MKAELFENALQTGGIWKRWLCVLVWTENDLKTELFENDSVLIMMWLTLKGALKLFCRWWLLRFRISPAWCEQKIFDAFSEWKFLRRFEVHICRVDQCSFCFCIIYGSKGASLLVSLFSEVSLIVQLYTFPGTVLFHFLLFCCWTTPLFYLSRQERKWILPKLKN